MRMLATITVQPHVKGKLTPEKLLPLPWEHKRPPVERLSKEERRERMAAAIERGKRWMEGGGSRGIRRKTIWIIPPDTNAAAN